MRVFTRFLQRGALSQVCCPVPLFKKIINHFFPSPIERLFSECCCHLVDNRNKYSLRLMLSTLSACVTATFFLSYLFLPFCSNTCKTKTENILSVIGSFFEIWNLVNFSKISQYFSLAKNLLETHVSLGGVGAHL